MEPSSKGLGPTGIGNGKVFMGTNYLFVIAIDAYHHWRPLNCAVKDVEDFADLLKEKYQYSKDDVHYLRNEEATSQNIQNGLEEYITKVTEKDTLTIYFSGHGHYKDVSKANYWIPVEAQKGNKNSHQFLNTAIVAETLRSINSLHTFVIIDSCFSGALITNMKGNGIDKPRNEDKKSRRIFASGRKEVMDGFKGGNSPFAEALLMTLRHNKEAYLSASELIVEVKKYAGRIAEQTAIDGPLSNSGHNWGDFFFHLKENEENAWNSTLEKNTNEGYLKFTEQFPRSPFASEARKRIEALEKGKPVDVPGLEEWLALKGEGTYKEYQKFIEQFPSSRFVKDAREEMNFLAFKKYNEVRILNEDEGALKETKLKAFTTYLENYSGSDYDRNVRRMQNDLLHFSELDSSKRGLFRIWHS